MEIGRRIFDLRKHLGLNQADFGKRIGVTRSAVCNYENGSRSIGEQVVLAICREFNVSETWLRTGSGDMQTQQTREFELTAMVNNLLAGESSDFRLRLATALSRMNPAQWGALETLALELTKRPIAQAPDPPAIQTDEDIEKQVAEYRRQLIEEKERAAKSSTSQSDTGNSGKKMA